LKGQEKLKIKKQIAKLQIKNKKVFFVLRISYMAFVNPLQRGAWIYLQKKLEIRR